MNGAILVNFRGSGMWKESQRERKVGISWTKAKRRAIRVVSSERRRKNDRARIVPNHGRCGKKALNMQTVAGGVSGV